MARKTTFKRRPNNSGTVVKLSGKRRKPYCARILSDERDLITGKKKQLCIGTFETELEALNALSLYHMTERREITTAEARKIDNNLFEQIKLRNKDMPTFKEIYDIIFEKEISNLSKSSIAGYNSWIKHFECIYNLKINEIDLKTLQEVFDNDSTGSGTKMHMKTLCTKVFKYAVINKYISKDDDYTEFIKYEPIEKSDKHYTFSFDEIKQLKEDKSDTSKIILIYIYSGLRANELLNIDRKDIHIDEICNDDGVERKVSYFFTGLKSEAGRNRIVPIHKYIQPFVEELLLCKRKRIIDVSYDTFLNDHFRKKMKELNMAHTMHDTRVTFTTLCQLNNVDVFDRKRILGHKIKDITFDVYTDTIINRLYTEINKIKL